MDSAATGVSGFCIRLENHQRVRCLGVVRKLEVEAYLVKTIVDFHVIPAGLGAYPIILGRPWLRAVNAVQDWKRGTISLYGRTGERRLYDMDSRRPLDGDSEDEDESSEEDSSTVSDDDSDSTISSEEDADLAFLLVDKEFEDFDVAALADGDEEDFVGPYEVIEGLMQPKVKVSKKLCFHFNECSYASV